MCAALMQMRARVLISGVAGKPTTVTAIPRSNARREKLGILPGKNNMMGCGGQEEDE